ncbi:MAG TPA: penicillin acylase family protein, partial [Geminicoccaceae bacterium]|nr:penicillin acylase family protein [Geminicoccaceae bacterium]
MFHDLAGRWRLPRLPRTMLRRLLGLPRRAPTRAERLAMFPASDLPLERPATIRWNDHLVPFVEARTDRDLAFCLGMVHAHLREGQMEFLKLLAHGRLAEFLGPLAFNLDHAIRIVDFAFAADAIERGMPEETRTWTQAYVDGLNHYWARVPRRTPEFRLLGRGHEPWTIRDVCTVGRLVGADFYWLAYLPLLKERGKPGFAELWRRVREAGECAAEPSGVGGGPAAVSDVFAAANRAGSNAVAVAQHQGRRMRSAISRRRSSEGQNNYP